jgi:hypothetical protein
MSARDAQDGAVLDAIRPHAPSDAVQSALGYRRGMGKTIAIALMFVLSAVSFVVVVTFTRGLDDLSARVKDLEVRLADAEADRDQKQKATAANVAAVMLVERHADLADEHLIAKAEWWCNSALCFRAKSDCMIGAQQLEERGTKAGDCEPARRAFCFAAPEVERPEHELCSPVMSGCAAMAKSAYLCHGVE